MEAGEEDAPQPENMAYGSTLDICAVMMCTLDICIVNNMCFQAAKLIAASGILLIPHVDVPFCGSKLRQHNIYHERCFDSRRESDCCR